jgi:glutamyl/glutaminyl-tRNA synthetase
MIQSGKKYNVKTRLAPTPSGFLHIGNGASFVATWALARMYEGQILLRIDDLDAERMRTEYVDDIFRTLDWLGVDWHEGPFSTEDFTKNWSQHLRLDAYEKALLNLQKTGDLYVCNCSRKDIRERSTNGLYPNTCRPNRLNPTSKISNYEKNTAWRIVVEEGKSVRFKNIEKTDPLSINAFFDGKSSISKHFDVNLSVEMGDFIVRQKNGLPSYQLASLVDDVFFGVNFIVRGEDLLHSTAAQIFLAERLNISNFLETTFWHHPLITEKNGSKLSKSEGAASLLALREAGHSAAIVVREAAKWLGFSDFQGETAVDLVAVLTSAR